MRCRDDFSCFLLCQPEWLVQASGQQQVPQRDTPSFSSSVAPSANPMLIHRAFSCISFFSPNSKRTIEKNYISICPAAMQFRNVSVSPALKQPRRTRFWGSCSWFCPHTFPESWRAEGRGPVVGREGEQAETLRGIARMSGQACSVGIGGTCAVRGLLCSVLTMEERERSPSSPPL